MNLKNLLKIANNELVRGILKISEKSELVCGECHIGKQVKASQKATDWMNTCKILELTHMYLLGPMSTHSMGGKRYALMVVDDF